MRQITLEKLTVTCRKTLEKLTVTCVKYSFIR